MEENRAKKLEALAVPLPEDIEKLKWHGDFERALKLIEVRLEKRIPEMMRERLLLEKEILKRLPLQYCYTREEAFRLASSGIRDFSSEEMEHLFEDNAIEWIFIDGEQRIKDDFFENLVKTRMEIRKRLLNPSLLEDGIQESRLRDETAKKMRDRGGLAYYFRVRSTFRIKKEAERPGEKVRVYLPIPLEYSQVKKFRLLNTSMEPFSVAPPLWPQRTVCFEKVLKEGDSFSVEYEFENHMNYTDADPGRAVGEPDRNQMMPEGKPLSYWLSEQLPQIRFTPFLRELVKEVTGEETNPLLKARLIYEYITSHITYSFVRAYFTITDIAEYAAAGQKGDCGIQALLFIVMCRIAGVPARWQAGLYANPFGIGCHDWAQFYIEPYGWLYADCSFGGGAYREGAGERREFYFGNLDPFRIPSNSEFGWEFTPPMRHPGSDVYDNQTGEAEYEDRALIREETECVHEMLEFREIPFQTSQ